MLIFFIIDSQLYIYIYILLNIDARQYGDPQSPDGNGTGLVAGDQDYSHEEA